MKLITEASADKLRGGFYTPQVIVDFILKWGFTNNIVSDILEPSCGDGNFLRQLKKSNYEYKNLTAIEFDKVEFEKAASIKLKNKKILNTDFLEYFNTTNEKYDLIVGNPPYIRYQFLDSEQKTQAKFISERVNIKYSKLTNIWVSFVIGCSLLLKEKGKLGFVLPAEILQVSYAKELRKFLAKFYNEITIISFEKLVFPDIQQEVVLLLCDKNESKDHYINHIELKNAESLKDLKIDELYKNRKTIDFNLNKWTFYFLTQDEIDFLENVSEKYKLPKIGDFASIEVGITTGANSFFTISEDIVNQYNLHEFTKPMVGRSVQVNSLIFNNEDWKENVNNGSRAFLLTFSDKDVLEGGAKNYIIEGEINDIHKGYKTSIRENWYVVPSIKLSDALFVRRNHMYPKLVINEAKAYTTDTMHRVFVNKDVNIDSFIASYYNSLTFAFTEVSGRSHGGGVLELMPNEVESVVLPYNKKNEVLLKNIDKLIREKVDIEDVLKYTNKVILKENLKMTNKEIDLVHNIWKKLMMRRVNRD